WAEPPVGRRPTVRREPGQRAAQGCRRPLRQLRRPAGPPDARRGCSSVHLLLMRKRLGESSRLSEEAGAAELWARGAGGDADADGAMPIKRSDNVRIALEEGWDGDESMRGRPAFVALAMSSDVA